MRDLGYPVPPLPDIILQWRGSMERPLALDDAHAIGVLGPNGDGTAAHFGMTDEVDIIAGTFSKSLASIGGFVAASESVIHYLRHHSRPLIFTASLPPANTAGVLAALAVLQQEPERRDRLWANTAGSKKDSGASASDIGPTRHLRSCRCSSARWRRPS